MWTVGISLLAHTALVYATGLIQFPLLDEPDITPVNIVLLRELPTPPTLEDLAPEPPIDEDAPEPAGERTPEAVASEDTPAAPTEPEETPPATDDATEGPAPSIHDPERTREQRERLQITDLEFAAALAVERAKERLREGPRLRTFSLADLDPEEPIEEPRPEKSVFDSPSVGRAGLESVNALNQVQRWVTDDCLQTTGTGNMFGFPAGAAIYNLSMTNCQKTNPRDDLFEHLKRDTPASRLP